MQHLILFGQRLAWRLLSNPKFACLVSALVLLSQRLPLLKHLFSRPLLVPSYAQVSKMLLPASAVTFGGIHAVSGATTEVFAVEGFENPAQAKVGEEFSWAFFTQRHKARAYEITGLPEGIAYPGVVQNSFSSIVGTPTEPGTFEVFIRGWRFGLERGQATPDFKLVINVEGGEAPGGYEQWKAETFSEVEQDDTNVSGAEADPDGDGLKNVLEYALNLDPKAAAPGGFPVLRREEKDGQLFLVFSSEKRVGANDVAVAVELATDLKSESWSAVANGEAGVEIEENEQSLTVRVPLNPKQRFVRLRASLNP